MDGKYVLYLGERKKHKYALLRPKGQVLEDRFWV